MTHPKAEHWGFAFGRVVLRHTFIIEEEHTLIEYYCYYY